jgi:membrane protease YdiL (CAAX protease family)
MLIRAACFLLVLLGSSSLVIAQTPQAGPAGGEVDSQSGLLRLVVWGVIGALSLLLCLRFRFLGPTCFERPTAPVRRWHPVLYLAVFILALLAQMLATGVAVSVMGLPQAEAATSTFVEDGAVPGPDLDDAPADHAQAPQETIRQSALLALASQAGALVVLFALYAATRKDLGPPCEPVVEEAAKATAPSAERSTWQRLPRPLRLFAIGLLGLALTYPLAQLAGYLGAWVQYLSTGEPPGKLSHATLQLLSEARADEALWVVLLSVTVVVLVPALEELMYRFGLQGSIVRLTGSRGAAIFATASLFALLHLGAVPASAVPALVVLGIGFGVVYERTGSLTAAIVMHAGFNALNLAALFFI